MMPTLSKTNFIFYIKRKEYKIGDIVIFKGSDSKIYCHRVILSDGKRFTMIGDNRLVNEKYETGIPVSDIKGKLVFHIP